MGIFDKYKGDLEFEDLPIIKTKQLLNVPFKIEKLYLKDKMESEFGAPRTVMIVTLSVIETGERFVWFAENTVVLKKLTWLKESGEKFDGVPFKIVYVEAAANNYYDIVEA